MYTSNSNTKQEFCQECVSGVHSVQITPAYGDSVLVDIDYDRRTAGDSNNDEIIKKFQPKKKYSVLLSESYSRLALSRDPAYNSRSSRVFDCATLLEFRKALSDHADDSIPFKLTKANFCRDRLCPTCSWRRTMKIFGQVSQIMDKIDSDYDYIFLTLTVPNCSGVDLPGLISDLQKGFHRFVNYKRFKSAVVGFFRALEVTRNKDPTSKSYGTYHPHFHCILVVRKSYFKKKDYIHHDEFLKMWQKAMKDPTITQVFVERVRPGSAAEKEGAAASELLADSVKDLKAGVAEVAKYSVKSSDYIYEGNEKLTDEVVFTIAEALRGRRLCAFGGIFEDIRKQLQLDDAEDGDLIKVGDDEKLRPDVAYMVRRFRWNVGAYELLDDFVEFENE